MSIHCEGAPHKLLKLQCKALVIPHFSLVVGCNIDDINWPPDVTAGAIVRNGEALISTGGRHIKHNDHAMLLIMDNHRVPAVKHLFGERQRRWLHHRFTDKKQEPVNH